MAAPYKPFDSTTKQLVEADPVAWLHYFGLPGEEAQVIESDLTTVIANVDKILYVKTENYLAHIEFQSTHDPTMDDRETEYAVLASVKYHLPVQGVVVLLRPEADGVGVTGIIEWTTPKGRFHFDYLVVRVWETPMEFFLTGSMALLPLAPLGKWEEVELPEVLHRMEERVTSELNEGEQKDFWAHTYLLLGLQCSWEQARQLLKGVRAMKESSTYQAILAEGREEGLDKGRKEGLDQGLKEGERKGRKEEALRLINIVGVKRFGKPSAEVAAKLKALPITRLEALAGRLMEVETWGELLA